MKFYRVHYFDQVDSSHGFEWFSVKREAEAAKGRFNRANKSKAPNAEVLEIEVEPTKEGIRSALNRYARHADNG